MRSNIVFPLITVAVLSIFLAGCAGNGSEAKPLDRGDYERQQAADSYEQPQAGEAPSSPSTESPEPYIPGGDPELYEDNLDEGVSNIEQVY